jgi:hypothetical protein
MFRGTAVAVETSTEKPCSARDSARGAVSLVPPKSRIVVGMG